MKKKLFGMLGALFAAALCAAVFTACDGGTGGSDSTEEPTTDGSDTTVEETTTYAITTQSDVSYYLISTDKSTAAEGETVTVTVRPMSNVAITAVYYNGTECENGSEDDGNYTCTFEMPAEKVTITADATMSVTFTYNNKSGYSDTSKIYILIMDNDIGTSSYQTIYLSEFDSDKEYSFKYVVGHTYNVVCTYLDGTTPTTLYFSNWTGSNAGGVTNTLTRNGTYAHYTLTLETPGITAQFTITKS